MDLRFARVGIGNWSPHLGYVVVEDRGVIDVGDRDGLRWRRNGNRLSLIHLGVLQLRNDVYILTQVLSYIVNCDVPASSPALACNTNTTCPVGPRRIFDVPLKAVIEIS